MIFFVVLTAFSALLQPGILKAQDVPNDWPETEARLRGLLAGTSEEKRTALYEIRNIRNEQASRLAVAVVSDPDEMIRATAAGSVIFLPEAEARGVLLPLLDDKRPFVRREAAYALGKIENWGASLRLRRTLLNDRDLEVRSASAVALGQIGDPSAIDDLIAILQKRPKDEEEFLRRASARAIGQIFELHHTGKTATVTPQNFLPLKFKESGPARPGSAPPADADRVIAVLSQVLRNTRESDDTRREAAFALGAMRRPDSAAVLLSYLDSPDPYLAEIVKEALLKIEKPS